MYIANIDKDVQKFSTFTVGLKQAAQYLKAEKVEKIVMEVTGIYWIPVIEEGIKRYEAWYKEQQDKFLQRKATEMGYLLVKI